MFGFPRKIPIYIPQFLNEAMIYCLNFFQQSILIRAGITTEELI